MSNNSDKEVQLRGVDLMNYFLDGAGRTKDAVFYKIVVLNRKKARKTQRGTR